jgi:hypothetical protein
LGGGEYKPGKEKPRRLTRITRMKVREEEICKRVLLGTITTFFSHDYYPEMELWPLPPTQDYHRSYIMEARYTISKLYF